MDVSLFIQIGAAALAAKALSERDCSGFDSHPIAIPHLTYRDGNKTFQCCLWIDGVENEGEEMVNEYQFINKIDNIDLMPICRNMTVVS